MAYITITNDEANIIRNNIKKAFPGTDGWKWSIKNNDMSMHVNLVQFPQGYNFPDEKYLRLNLHHLDETKSLGEKEKAVMMKVNEILRENHWKDSDSNINSPFDYYVRMAIGQLNKPAVQANK